jgi:hypothetical protein
MILDRKKDCHFIMAVLIIYGQVGMTSSNREKRKSTPLKRHIDPSSMIKGHSLEQILRREEDAFDIFRVVPVTTRHLPAGYVTWQGGYWMFGA